MGCFFLHFGGENLESLESHFFEEKDFVVFFSLCGDKALDSDHGFLRIELGLVWFFCRAL